MGYEVNYDDERFNKVESEKQDLLQEIDDKYSGMIDQADQYYRDQQKATEDWAEKQTQLQQEQTDHTTDKIEQQKEQAKKDYIKEQSGAYADWQKQSNQYGVNAEQMAEQGLTKSGYSETSQVGMYTAYQSRVATARYTFNRAVLEYDNAIKDAQLQNSSTLAQIAYEALQKKLELGLQGFQYKNQLLLDQFDRKLAAEESYYGRYQDVLNQLNYENEMDFQREQFEESVRQFNEQMRKSSGGGGGDDYYEILGDVDETEDVEIEETEKGSWLRNLWNLLTNKSSDDSSSATVSDYINALRRSGVSQKEFNRKIDELVADGVITNEEANRYKSSARYATK